MSGIVIFLCVISSIFFGIFEVTNKFILAIPVILTIMTVLFFFVKIYRSHWFDYRLTKLGIEIHHWQAAPKNVFFYGKILFRILGISVIVAGLVINSNELVMVGITSVLFTFNDQKDSIAIFKQQDRGTFSVDTSSDQPFWFETEIRG